MCIDDQKIEKRLDHRKEGLKVQERLPTFPKGQSCPLAAVPGPPSPLLSKERSIVREEANHIKLAQGVFWALALQMQINTARHQGTWQAI